MYMWRCDCMEMSISEKIRVLCAGLNISSAELARRLGQSPQNFNAKLRRESFSVSELQEIAEAAGVRYESNFVLDGTERI